MNTLIYYQYRDASNYKQANQVVFEGEITSEEKQSIVNALDQGTYFIPAQVGLEELQHHFPTLCDDDHVWHELREEDIELTPAAPTQKVDIHEFARLFAVQLWDVPAAEKRIGI